MEDADDVAHTLPTWAALFARAETYEVDESVVSEALARRRERADD